MWVRLSSQYIYIYLKKSKIIQDLLDKLYITFIKSFLDHRFILEKIIEQFHKDKYVTDSANNTTASNIAGEQSW